MFTGYRKLTDLPPTRTEIIETNWMEYLQWVKDEGERKQCRPSERAFWKWYLKYKVEPSDA